MRQRSRDSSTRMTHYLLAVRIASPLIGSRMNILPLIGCHMSPDDVDPGPGGTV